MKIVIASGYFNPLHIGHIRYLKAAKALGDYLVVIVNNDKQVALKGSVPFMQEKDRWEIVKSLKFVDRAIISIDDDRTVIATIEQYCYGYYYKTVFANGGDVIEDNCREAEFCMLNGIELVYGVGGNTKERSSSELLARHKIQVAN
jgi:cytidyltransferase-like protein